MKNEVFVGDIVIDIDGIWARMLSVNENGYPTLATGKPPKVAYHTPEKTDCGFVAKAPLPSGFDGSTPIEPGMVIYFNGEIFGTVLDPNAPIPPKTLWQRIRARWDDVCFRIEMSSEKILLVVVALVGVASFKYEHYFLACFCAYVCGILDDMATNKSETNDENY